MSEEALTVTELTRGIKHILEMSFERLCVLGEISNLARPNSGHLYFNLKDEGSQIRGVMFRSSAQRTKFLPENGLEVFCYGRITVYEPRGDYQIIVDRMEPYGAGALQLAFEQLKEKLADEGLFDPENKQELPTIPKGIGVVTSPTGAAIQDILNILSRRYPDIPVLINPVLVQGDQAAGEIAQAIDQLNRMDEIDVMIVGRGGGSIEDLWAFNEEVVARAIHRSKIPVISAVGHETDFTIADFVADLRAPTPSAAAELVVPLKEDLELRLAEATDRLDMLVQRKLQDEKDRLEYLTRRLRSPEAAIQAYQMKIDNLDARLNQSVLNGISQLKAKTESLTKQLELLSPENSVTAYRTRLDELSQSLRKEVLRVLEKKQSKAVELTRVLDSVSPLATMGRGYSIATKATGQVISKISQVKPGSNLLVRLKDGKVETEVKQILPDSDIS